MNHRQPVYYNQAPLGLTTAGNNTTPVPGLKSKYLQNLNAAFRVGCRVIGEHRLFVIPVLSLALIAMVLSNTITTSIELKFSLYNECFGFSLGLFIFLFMLLRTFEMMFVIKPEHPISYLISDFRRSHMSLERLMIALILIVLFPLFSSSFTYCKSMISVINPFEWDLFLSQLDRMIHFGIDPWRLLQPILGYPLVTRTINIFYNVWMFFWMVYLLYIFFSVHKEYVRMQFLITFIMSWIVLGFLMATVFSSAGPCFFSNLYPDNPYYADLMTYLNTANESTPIWAVTTQAALWKKYTDIAIGVGSGISAMPSMHVSITFLVTLTQFQINRKIGLLFLAYTFVILLGSVHLAWHYAVDGYMSLIVTYLIWYSVGKYLPRQALKN